MFYDNIKSHKIGRYIFTEKPEGGGGGGGGGDPQPF